MDVHGIYGRQTCPETFFVSPNVCRLSGTKRFQFQVRTYQAELQKLAEVGRT